MTYLANVLTGLAALPQSPRSWEAALAASLFRALSNLTWTGVGMKERAPCSQQGVLSRLRPAAWRRERPPFPVLSFL